MNNRHIKLAKITCKHDESVQKQSLDVLTLAVFVFCCCLFASKTKNFMIRDQEKHNLEKNYIWNPITASYHVNTDLSHQCETLEAKSQTTLLQNTNYCTWLQVQFCPSWSNFVVRNCQMTTSPDIKTSCVLISSK